MKVNIYKTKKFRIGASHDSSLPQPHYSRQKYGTSENIVFCFCCNSAAAPGLLDLMLI
jgi:hypothetical protein